MIRPFKRKPIGMIRPGMALDYMGSRRIADRKSVAMVTYLRMRRAISDPQMDQFRPLHIEFKKGARMAHLRGKP
jgi:hypothetical protein